MELRRPFNNVKMTSKGIPAKPALKRVIMREL